MTVTALAPPRFVRRTRLGGNEYRRNFHQIDHDVLTAITSAEANRVTPLMSKIYLRLVLAQPKFWEREGVLYFAAGEKNGQPVKASKVLYELLGVASATAHKALGWMHGQGIIGYFAGKNGAGIRIFINRAAGSIGVRAPAAAKKILPFPRGSNGDGVGSTNEPAFNDSFAVSESLDIDLISRAPENGAETNREVLTQTNQQPPVHVSSHDESRPTRGVGSLLTLDEVARRLLLEIGPSINMATAHAAAREHERTREWLENKGLPKVARVAQREAYNVLRQFGVMAQTKPSHAEVGRNGCASSVPQKLADNEVMELAEACVSMLEAKGQAVEITLSEMSVTAGGFLLLEDATRVREKAATFLADKSTP